jgi:hypothetical protein
MDYLRFQSLKGIELGLAGKLTVVSTDLFFSIPKRDLRALQPVNRNVLC